MEEKDRIAAFTKDYGKLVEKHKIDFANFPMFVPDGTPGGFRVIVQSMPVDITQQAVKSPFIG